MKLKTQPDKIIKENKMCFLNSFVRQKIAPIKVSSEIESYIMVTNTNKGRTFAGQNKQKA